jgi:RNA polymerase sigma factor for flagellar operon FliA
MSTTLTAPPMETTAVTVPSGVMAQELWQRYHQQSPDAKSDTENALVQKYLPLVSAVVNRLAMTLPEHVDHDDLYSVGLIGLLQALRNYNPACGTSFETYARVRVRGAMLDELRRMDWVPRTIHEKARRIKVVLGGLEQKLGKTPTEAQMAKAMELSLKEYQELLDEVRPAAFVCLDAVNTSDEGEGGPLYEVIADQAHEGPVEKVSNNELKRVIFERLKELPDMQRKVLALYYLEDMHLREIAEVFKLTESRICQIHAQAILSIRSYLQRFESGLSRRATTGRQT